MAKTRDSALLTGQTAPELNRELTFSLQRILDRLDKLEGIRGDAEQQAVEFGNNLAITANVYVYDDDGNLIHSFQRE